MHPRLAKLKKEAPEEIPLYLKAGGLLKKIDGINIQGDDMTVRQIYETLNFKPKTLEGEECKRNILKTAKQKARQGMFGDGVFLID